MIRDRIKARLARFVGRPVPSAPPQGGRPRVAPTEESLRRIPRVQPGSGDTPGPNHKEDIGVSFLAAQVSSGAAPLLLDLRSRDAWARSHLPGAVHVDDPRRLIAGPVDEERLVVVYDADDTGPAADAARRLRDAGWAGARRLVGGHTAWVAQGEPVEPGREPETP